MKRILLILIAAATVLTGCRNDSEDFTTNTTSTGFVPPAVYINGTVAGQVLTEAGMPVAGATVKAGKHQAETSDEGHFILRNIPMNTHGALLHIDHPGFWHASRKVVPKHNGTHYTSLTLVQRQFNAQVSTATGGEVILPSGMKIEFGANSFALSNGTPYTGTVVLAARWADPFYHDHMAVMPGSMQGINAQNKEVTLSSYGIAGVEMLGSGGESIRLAEGATATLEFPIPQQTMGTAPSAISLWHYDELAGFWREEGHATLEGNIYRGEVAHFSFWSPADGFDTVMLEGTIVDSDSNPIANTQVTIIYPAQNMAASGFTNADGTFSGMVPSGQPLILMVSDQCNFTVFSQNIPPLSENTNIGTITAPVGSIATTTISGTLTNCDGDPVSNGIVQICWSQGCQFILAGFDGSFNQTFSWCGATSFDIGIIDYNTGQTLALNQAPTATIALGTIQVCDGPLETFISFSYPGGERFYPFPTQYIQNGRVFLRAENSNYTLTISIPEGATGTYQNADVSFNLIDYASDPNIPLSIMSGSCFIGECTNFTVIISQYGNVGEFIEGTYSGVLDITTSTQSFPNSAVSGAFRVVRLM